MNNLVATLASLVYGRRHWRLRVRLGTRSPFAAACVVVALFAHATTASAAELQVGDEAPAFTLESTAGGTYSLSGRPVVLAWFPKAFTQGCTIECKSLAENGYLIREFDVDYFMVSTDPIADNADFAAENNADFPMLSDPTKQTAEAYGVLHERGFAKRHTFYIGADGVILAIDRAVNPATAAEDIAATLAQLDVPRQRSDETTPSEESASTSIEPEAELLAANGSARASS